MSPYDKLNITCFLLVMLLSVVMGIINRIVWKDMRIPSLVWILIVDFFAVILLVYRIVIL